MHNAKGTEAILESYSAITNALSYLNSDVNEKGDSGIHANNLLQKMKKNGICVYVAFLNQRARSFSQGQQSRSGIRIIIEYLWRMIQFICGFSKQN